MDSKDVLPNRSGTPSTRPSEENAWSRRLHRERCRFTRRFTFLALLAVCLWALGLSGHWRITMDSALYAEVARNIVMGEASAHPPAVEFNTPPIVPVCLAASYAVGRAITPGLSLLDAFLYFNVFEALAGLAGLAAAFLFALEVAGRRRALLVLLMLTTSAAYYVLSTQPMTDVPYCAVSWAALLFVARADRRGGWGNRAAAAFFLALAPLTRLAGLALALSVAAVYTVQAFQPSPAPRRRASHLWTFAPALAAGVAALTIVARSGAAGGSFSYVTDVTQRSHWEILLQAASNLRDLPGRILAVVAGRGRFIALGLPLVAVIAAGGVIRWRRRFGQVMVAYLAAYLAAVVLPTPEVAVRYLVPLLPVIYLLAAEGFAFIADRLRDNLPRRWRTGGRAVAAVRATVGLAGKGLVAATVAVNLALVGVWLAPGYSGDFYGSYERGFYKDYMSLSAAIADAPPRGVLMARHSRLIHVLSDVASTTPPYGQFSKRRPDAVQTGRYIRKYNVTAVVLDPRCTDSARVLTEFLKSEPLHWRPTASYGALTLYELDVEPRRDAAGPSEVPGSGVILSSSSAPAE